MSLLGRSERKITALWANELKAKKSFLAEKGQVDFTDILFNPETVTLLGKVPREYAKKIKKVPYNFNLLFEIYRKIPKVMRAINSRANFAVQAGYRLIGDDADIKKIRKWERKNHFDLVKIQIAKEMLIAGNVYQKPVGEGEKFEAIFLPQESMRVVREKTGVLVGHCQIHNNKMLARWEPDEIFHFKWNSLGSQAYGVPELFSAKYNLEIKLETENLIKPIIKAHLENRVIFRCGSPDKPYSEEQMNDFKSNLENRSVGGDLIVPGDVVVEVVQAASRLEGVLNLIKYNEAQVDAGLYFPAVLMGERGGGDFSANQFEAYEKDLKTIQDVLGMGIEKYYYTKILGKEDVPEIRWNHINIETMLRTSRALRQFVGDGTAPPILTIDEARNSIGYSPMTDEEREKTMPAPPIKGGPNEPRKPFGDAKPAVPRHEED